jgi:hypothetical protein
MKLWVLEPCSQYIGQVAIYKGELLLVLLSCLAIHDYVNDL